MMLDDYPHTKNIVVSHSATKLGLFDFEARDTINAIMSRTDAFFMTRSGGLRQKASGLDAFDSRTGQTRSPISGERSTARFRLFAKEFP
jgi:hypothetical protein